MTDTNDFDDNEDVVVDEDESKAAEKGAAVNDATVSDADVAEAETLTVTAKLRQRQALEDEVAAFLANGGKIKEVPPDESAHD
ncbi:hypothetical protein [Acinetobacter shaoyimingii]|uniref:Transcriptional regulator SutA RNAP-binding domain-containing protein n=1 Tax=Acinetobacter shaoyimingii TaxID=2715164 RepID=A0A6G8RX02_9GAMM|nr:hypothetical protein [Acinetobacter shaoyimingii]NHB57830.1 hypothetical protein [Acinetobacter shaoyimingii]QIO06434.1 hypothetical protein G8E00_10950 [Acinetobacter shaoyimingii]